MGEIIFKENISSEEDIALHLQSCGNEFYKELSARTDISQYIKKLAEKSFRHEAWSDKKLIGLVAVYYNGPQSGFDFITNVTISINYTGQGIATRLLSACLDKTQAPEIRLEVAKDNLKAQMIYKKSGFSLLSEKDALLYYHKMKEQN